MASWPRSSALAAPAPSFGRPAKGHAFEAPIDPAPLKLAAIILVAVVAWLGLIFAVAQVRFVIVATEAKTGFEVFLALLRFFAALVLVLFAAEAERPRLRWVALGFVILGLGGLVFGYLYPAAVDTVDLNATMYGSLLSRSLAALIIAIGLVPSRPPQLSVRATLLALGGFALLSASIAAERAWLPPLVTVDDLEAVASTSTQTLTGLTGWHWALSLLALVFAMAAAVGAARHYPGRALGGWVVAAMALMAGSQLHSLFWPSAYSPVLTTSSLLRLAFTVVVAVGGYLELRRVAAERATALALERKYVAQLHDLATLKADFTAVVAHELGNPLATIRQAVELLETGPLDAVQARALAAVKAESAALTALVADVRAAAEAERDDFDLQPRRVLVADLLVDAACGLTLPGDHAVSIESTADVPVWSDPVRIGQVLRNLLSNAAKYSPPRAPITLRATRHGKRVRIAVIDHGYGIHPDDMRRIFEKFGRGRNFAGQKIPGVGLGLYLSRRIVCAHGSDLTVESTLGAGSVFSFDLEVAP